MSNARPHRPWLRFAPTPRQSRRFNRKLRVWQDVELLKVLDHGGSGVPVRKPLLHNNIPPVLDSTASLATHAAYHCKPCKDHARPRLHRVPRAVYFGVTP